MPQWRFELAVTSLAVIPAGLSAVPPESRGDTLINSARLLDTFLAILRMNSFHPDEDRIMEALSRKLTAVGMSVTQDATRNLLAYWPGTGDLNHTDPVLLCAHVDTVRPTVGMEPVVRDGSVFSDGSSVLGADDKAAVAAIVEAAEAISDASFSHPPVEVLFTIGEDVGHIGSKAFDVTPVRSKLAFIPDSGGPVGQIILASPWAQNVQVSFHGRAAHAGIEPENGRSALGMLARAVTELPWGRLDEGSTSNIGTVTGGEAANIVAPHAQMVFQVRSIDQTRHQQYIDDVLRTCHRTASELDGRIEHESLSGMSGFHFSRSDMVVERAASAVRAAGLEPSYAESCGGSDANELNAKGLTTVVLSVGYKDIHSVEESMPIDELDHLAGVCAALMLGK